MSGYRMIGGALIACCAVACGAGEAGRRDAERDSGEAAKTGAARAAIVGAFATPNPETQGVVNLHFPEWGGCSGVLISNRWVMTAKHCMLPDFGKPGTPLTFAYDIRVEMGTQTAWGWGLTEMSDDEGISDIALFELEFPLEMNGSDTGYYANWWAPPPDAELQQFGVVCEGYGGTSVNPNGGGYGVLRAGWYGTKTVWEPRIDLDTSVSSTPSWGDSGGPCFSPLTGELIAINSGFVDPTTLIPYKTFRPSSAYNQDWIWYVLDTRGW